MIRALRLFVCSLFFIGPVSGKPSVVTLETRPRIKMRFLVDQPAQLRRGTLLLFVGGNGGGGFSHEKGKVRLGGNFLARIVPRFVAKGFAVVLLDTPSDQPEGYSSAFRLSQQHVQDVSKVIEYLVKKGMDDITLVGTSRGTISVAALASKLDGHYVKNIVLTSTITGEVGKLPLAEIQQPVLLIHHTLDACRTSPYEEAVPLRKLFKKSGRVHFVGVIGDTVQASTACSARSPHGFLGKEGPVVDTIIDWIAGKEPPAKI